MVIGKLIRFLILAAIVPIAAGLAGCNSANPPAYSDLVVAIDTSGSTETFRTQQLNDLDTAEVKACVFHLRLTVWVFDSSPRCVWSGIPASTDELNWVKDRYMQPAPHDLTRRITRPGALLKGIATDKKLARARGIRLVIETDGDFTEDASDIPMFNAAAAKLAARRDLKVTVADILPENRTQWTSAFSACIDRLDLAGISQASQSVIRDLQ